MPLHPVCAGRATGPTRQPHGLAPCPCSPVPQPRTIARQPRTTAPPPRTTAPQPRSPAALQPCSPALPVSPRSPAGSSSAPTAPRTQQPTGKPPGPVETVHFCAERADTGLMDPQAPSLYRYNLSLGLANQRQLLTGRGLLLLPKQGQQNVQGAARGPAGSLPSALPSPHPEASGAPSPGTADTPSPGRPRVRPEPAPQNRHRGPAPTIGVPRSPSPLFSSLRAPASAPAPRSTHHRPREA